MENDGRGLERKETEEPLHRQRAVSSAWPNSLAVESQGRRQKLFFRGLKPTTAAKAHVGTHGEHGAWSRSRAAGQGDRRWSPLKQSWKVYSIRMSKLRSDIFGVFREFWELKKSTIMGMRVTGQSLSTAETKSFVVLGRPIDTGHSIETCLCNLGYENV